MIFQNYFAGKTALSVPAPEARFPFEFRGLRLAVWEEHCLECTAPQCFQTCQNYLKRQDGVCRLFENSILQLAVPGTLYGIGAHVIFRKWGNLMTIVYPPVLTPEAALKLRERNRRFERAMGLTVRLKLPVKLRRAVIRTAEYIRRTGFRRGGPAGTVNTFLLHAYSHEPAPFRLMAEVFDDHRSVYKMSFELMPGENLRYLQSENEPAWNTPGNLVKVYPENDAKAAVTFFALGFADCTPAPATPVQAPDRGAGSAAGVKCVAWDLDNTLWDGTLIETDAPERLRLRDGVLDMILELDRRGILQTVVSKNDFGPAFAQLQCLGVDEYFLHPMISWGPKSAAIEEIARKLNIGTDAFALFDDSPFERGEVGTQLPVVRCYDEKALFGVLDLPPFQVLITEESASRRSLYQAEEKRARSMTESAGDATEFLRSCGLTVTLFEPSSDEERTRCLELLQRTNQLNLSGQKYDRAAFDALMAEPALVKRAFSCEDRFGTYGIVCFCAYSAQNGILTFKEFAMSCRAAGKFVESAFFEYLKSAVPAEKYFFPLKITAKNGLLRRTLEEIGFDTVESDAAHVLYEFSHPLKNSDIAAVIERTGS